MRYCLFPGGKRFRPLLCLGGCEAVGGQASHAVTVACALELIHTYSLVHDDLPAMDNADERRGRPSCHRRFGEATAILVGDALLTRAFELLSTNGRGHVVDVIRTIGHASGTSGLIGGQLLDLSVRELRGRQQHPPTRQPVNPSTNVSRFEDIAKRKTAALIAASVVAGGVVGGGAPSAIARLRRYGQRLGLAFQLVDDLHDGEDLASALGPRAAQRRARVLIQEAREALQPFGARAATLRELTEWLHRLSAQEPR